MFLNISTLSYELLNFTVLHMYQQIVYQQIVSHYVYFNAGPEDALKVLYSTYIV